MLPQNVTLAVDFLEGRTDGASWRRIQHLLSTAFPDLAIGSPYASIRVPLWAYIADQTYSVIRKVTAATGIITTIAGNGTAGYSGNGGLAINAELNNPMGLAVDSVGNLYIADNANNAIRMVTASSGTISTVAGNPTNQWGGYSGDNGPATQADLNSPVSVSLDLTGNIFIADTFNGVIRKIAAGTITTVAGNGVSGYSGDGYQAKNAQLDEPYDVKVDSAGNIYIADYENQRIRKVDTNGYITTVAGNGTGGFAGDNGPATEATFWFPVGLAVDSVGNVYIVDSANHAVREIEVSTGVITSVAGIYQSGYAGDGGLGTIATLNYPAGIALAPPGGNFYSTDNIFFADSGNNVVRVVGGYRTAGPTFSPISATYATAQTVAISDSAPGATIYYTTDGTTPTTSSTVYSGAIAVSSSKTLNAIASTSSGQLTAVGTAPYTITTAPPTVNFASGFTSANLNLVNGAVISNGVLQLTDLNFYEARAAWFTTPVSALAFTSDFNYQATSAVADGIVFVLQNSPAGTSALGSTGGNIAYTGIDSSVAIKLDSWNNQGEGVDSTGFYTNGAQPMMPALDMTGSNMFLRRATLKH